jgi:uncharacterized protein (TIGR03663 family)
MKPQPPVTKMRIAARTSSDRAGALANFPMLRRSLEEWRTRLAAVGWAPWLIFGLAVFLRFLLLGIKPPHFDEGINGWFVDQMVKEGYYRYDPTNYHGPLHFYTLFLFKALFGRNLWALRAPVVLVSIACIWLALKFELLVGRSVARIAAAAMAVSPGFVFYGRYSIHEIWLVLFTMLFILGLLGLRQFGTNNYLWCAGMGAAGMILSKETYIIHIGCALIAFPILSICHWLRPIPGKKPARQTWSYVDLAMVIVVAVALVVFFYSGTFLHWSGVKGLSQAYAPWFTTGSEGHGHEKPWFYWLTVMAPSLEWGRADFLGYELPALVGLALCVLCLLYKNVNLRYLAIYGVGVLMVYSYVHYKTPWCIINIIWPFLFIFGAGVVQLAGSNQIAKIAAGVLLACSLGSTIWLNYFRCTTDTEPYVYVQTYNDIRKFTEPLFALAKRDRVTYHLPGMIIRSSSYPLPWVLGDFDAVGYYEHNNVPAKVDADFLLVQEDDIGAVEEKLSGHYYTDTLRIRSFQEPSKAYFRAKIFKPLFPNRMPDLFPKKSG